jgi:hypothetical protein
VPVLTAVLNIASLRRRSWTGISAVAVVLNVVCLIFSMLKPEFEGWATALAVWAVPVVNVIGLVTVGRGRGQFGTAKPSADKRVLAARNG